MYRFCNTTKVTLLGNTCVDFELSNFGPQFRTQFEEDWGYQVCGLVPGCDQNGLIDTIYINHLNGLL